MADRLAASFIQKKTLAPGGFGIVYLVEHEVFGEVAFKKIEVSEAKGEARFQNELKIHEGLNHENIVKLLGNHNVSTTRGLFLEYLEHGDVTNFIETFKVPWHWKTQIIYDVSLAMSYLHGKQPSIIHGDLTPGNILIDNGYRAKVSDFGLACFESETQTGLSFFGTTTYVAPEYLKNVRKQKTVKFDVYGYAISVWEIFSEKQHKTDFAVAETINEFVIKGERPSMLIMTIKYDNEIPDSIIQLIKNCWHEKELDRPTFENIANILSSELDRFEKPLQVPVESNDLEQSSSISLTEQQVQPSNSENKQGKSNSSGLKPTAVLQISTIEDRETFARGFNSVLHDLSKYIDCENGLLFSLKCCGVLSKEESEILDGKALYRDRNEYMLMHYIEPRINAKCTEFADALIKNEQEHIVKFIFTAGGNEEDDRVLTDNEIQIIDHNMFGLVNLINPYKDRFLARLVSKNCITSRHQDKVEYHKEFSKGVKELLTILKRRRYKDLCSFKMSLHDTMQNRIVELLEKSGLVAIRVKLESRPDIRFIESALIAHLTDYVEGTTMPPNDEQREFVDSVLKELEQENIRLIGNSTWSSLAVYFICNSAKSLEDLKKRVENGSLKIILERVYRALFKSPDNAPDLIESISLHEYPFQESNLDLMEQTFEISPAEIIQEDKGCISKMDRSRKKRKSGSSTSRQSGAANLAKRDIPRNLANAFEHAEHPRYGAPPRPKLSSSCSDQNVTNISQQPPAPKPRSINARPNNENPANETRPTSFMRDKNARPVPAQRKSLMSPDEHSEGSGAHVTSPPSVLPKPNRRTSCDSSLDVDSVSLDPVPEFGGAWLSDTRANIPPKPAVKTKTTIIRPKSMFVKSETLSLAMTNSNTHPDISHTHYEKHSTKPPEFPPKNQELEFPLKDRKSQFSPNNQQPEFPFKNVKSHLPPEKQLQEEFHPKKPEFPSKNHQPEFPSNTQQSEFPLKNQHGEFPPENQQPEMDLTEISSTSKQVASDKSPDTRTNDLKPLMKVKPSVMQKPTVPAKTPDATKAPDLPAQTPEIAKVANIRKCFDMETYERTSVDSEAFSFQKSFQDDHGKTAPLPKPPRAAPTIIRPGKISQGSSNELKEEEKCGFVDITQGEQKTKPEVLIQRVRPTIIRNKPKLVDQTQNDDCKSTEPDGVKISSPDGDVENKDETEVVFKAGNCKPEETLSPVIDGERGSEDKSHKPAAKPPPPKPSRPPARSSSAMENLNESSSSTSTAPPPWPTAKPGRPPPARPAAVPKRSTESSSNNPGLPPTLPGRPQLGHPLYHYVAKGPHAIALYDYASNQADELSFAAGDVVVLVKNINKDWLYGKTAKGEGMFPASFVDVVEAPASGSNEAAASVEKNENRRNNSTVSDPSFKSGPRCRARFDYDGEEIGDLAFLAGETIRLLEQIGSEWFRGESAGGKIGMFPASFVEVLEELPAPVESPDCSVFYSQEENVSSPDKISPVKTAEGSSVDMIDGQPHCIALYDFVGEIPDDLSFSCGDKILIHERVGTDWIKGELNGRTGILPAAFVNIVRDINDLPDEVRRIDDSPRSTSTSHGSNVESRPVDVQPTSPGTWKALALYEFPGESSEDLAFHAGEEIDVVETISAEWMKGRIGAREGMFPAAFVQKIDH